MLEINNQLIMDDIEDILIVLRDKLEIQGLQRFSKIIKSGNNIMTCCPFHKNGQEKKPSFGIHEKDGVCHCFGCGWRGTFAEMISNCFGKDDMGLYGTKWLARNFLTVIVEERPCIELDLSRNKKEQIVKYISDDILDTYRYIHPYMYKRRLTDEIIEAFDIGFDKNTRCITFPVRDMQGRCLFVARRSVDIKYFNYPQGVEKPVYGIYELSQLREIPKEIIICESMLDALTCWVYGKYAVALNGLGNELQFKQLNSLKTRKFILATDMDEAGKKARARIKHNITNKLVTEYLWDVKIAKDINDMDKTYFEQLKEVF